jgi:transcriptional regulator GlxA family with amidase domain
MSTRNFARRFTAATGETPLAYLHRLRIDAARHRSRFGPARTPP